MIRLTAQFVATHTLKLASLAVLMAVFASHRNRFERILFGVALIVAVLIVVVGIGAVLSSRTFTTSARCPLGRVPSL